MKKWICLGLCILIFVSMGNGVGIFAQAASKTVNIQILATGDMHGKINDINYETMKTTAGAGLSKVATLIGTERAKNSNTLLFDIGDFVFDYTTDFFYQKKPEVVQPMLQAINLLGYDAITMGNHEFDYSYKYFNKQLKDAGLWDRTIVANVQYDDSGDNAFVPGKILTKQFVATDGSKVDVKVGVVGATRQVISGKTFPHWYVYESTAPYGAIKAEAAKLKANGADIVVALLHGGIGSQNSKETDTDVGYLLSKLPEINAVVTGHTHKIYPYPDSPYDTLPNVKNGLMNGKPVIATGSRARGLGEIKMSLNVDSNNAVSVGKCLTGYLSVQPSTPNTASIKDLFAPYEGMLRAGVNPASYPIAKGVTYSNYDVGIKDSNYIQLMNNAKIDFASTYIQKNYPAYVKYPVVACSRNNATGMNDANDYLYETKNLTAFSVGQMVPYNTYICINKVTGSLIREWLEWSASCYAKKGEKVSAIPSFTRKNKSYTSIMNQANMYSLSKIYIFDGVSYQIDVGKAARYLPNGKIKSEKNHRIVNLKYNGKVVKDSDVFMMAYDNQDDTGRFVPKETDSLVTNGDYIIVQDLILQYLNKQSKFGAINIKADDNWSIKAPNNYKFFAVSSSKSGAYIKKQNWYKGKIRTSGIYSYYKGALKTTSPKMNVVVAPEMTFKVNKSNVVKVNAYGKYPIAQIKWLAGAVPNAANARWNSAPTLSTSNAKFTAKTNGRYSIRVTDRKGNKKAAQINIDNIDPAVLPQLTIDDITNRKTTLAGKTEPGAEVVLSVEDGRVYKAMADSNGTFALTIVDPLVSETNVTVQANKTINGILCKTPLMAFMVKKSGPDAPTVDSVTKRSTALTGITPLYTSLYLVTNNVVYVGKGKTDWYKTTDLYNSSRKVVETDITIDAQGKFNIAISPNWLGTDVRVYSVNRFLKTSKMGYKVVG